MKGASTTVSAVLVTAVTLSAVGVVLNTAGPAIERAQDAAAVDRAVSFMNQLDNDIKAVASEGEGSTRSSTLNFDRGQFFLNSSSNTLSYNIETSARPISPQSRTTIGDVALASNADLTVSKTTVDGRSCYMMENGKVEACISANGSSNSLAPLNTSELVVHYRVKGEGEIDLDPRIKLNGVPSSSYGQGYVEARKLGDRLTNGEIIAHVEADNGFNYRVLYELYSGSDFLSIRVLPEQ
ncbi:MAG: hypothetical protein ABEJ98_05425 [Candidatus Nanohaloarchaea archaeon]